MVGFEPCFSRVLQSVIWRRGITISLVRYLTREINLSIKV
jgi:hypothetical protein